MSLGNVLSAAYSDKRVSFIAVEDQVSSTTFPVREMTVMKCHGSGTSMWCSCDYVHAGNVCVIAWSSVWGSGWSPWTAGPWLWEATQTGECVSALWCVVDSKRCLLVCTYVARGWHIQLWHCCCQEPHNFREGEVHVVVMDCVFTSLSSFPCVPILATLLWPDHLVV